jgi:hypothetical protein
MGPGVEIDSRNGRPKIDSVGFRSELNHLFRFNEIVRCQSRGSEAELRQSFRYCFRVPG